MPGIPKLWFYLLFPPIHVILNLIQELKLFVLAVFGY